MTALLDAFKDIVNHTASLGFIDMVKIIGTGTEAKVETLDTANKSVVIYGDMYTPIDGVVATIGLSRIPVLKGYIDLHSESTVEVVAETRNGEEVPAELKFDNGAGFTSNYRFVSEGMVNEQVKVPPFRGATWNITIDPDKGSIDRMSKAAGILGSFEKTFQVSTDSKNTLNFAIGMGPTDRVTLPFAKNVNGALKHTWSYPLTQVLSILKLDGDIKMSFSDIGVMKIDIDSGIGRYTYVVPAVKI